MPDKPTPQQDWQVEALLDECERQEKFCREHGFPNPSLDTVDVRALLRTGARATVQDRVAAMSH